MRFGYRYLLIGLLLCAVGCETPVEDMPMDGPTGFDPAPTGTPSGGPLEPGRYRAAALCDGELCSPFGCAPNSAAACTDFVVAATGMIGQGSGQTPFDPVEVGSEFDCAGFFKNVTAIQEMNDTVTIASDIFVINTPPFLGTGVDVFTAEPDGTISHSFSALLSAMDPTLGPLQQTVECESILTRVGDLPFP